MLSLLWAGKIKKKSGDKTFYRPDREASLIKFLQKKNKSSIPTENIKFIIMILGTQFIKKITFIYDFILIINTVFCEPVDDFVFDDFTCA